MANDQVEIRLNAERHRFEIFLDGALAGHARFHDSREIRTFTHTEIDPSFEGRGLGGRQVREALDQTRAAEMSVVPECPFVRSFIENHQEYAGLVAAA
jgi:predicted GNAT family acetyltransferase